jgi:hypothetical protein
VAARRTVYLGIWLARHATWMPGRMRLVVGTRKEVGMDSIALVILLILAVVLVVIGAAFLLQRNRSEDLRRKFGPEYDQAVSQAGDRRKAESELASREKRVAAFNIRSLAPDERDRYATQWRAAQTRFVDEPRQAIVEADRLVMAVMEARGYPMGDFEQRAADLSVGHANVVTNYRAARQIARENEAGQASTEMLRQGMIHYRALFDDLLEVPPKAESRRAEQKELTK